MAKAETVRMKLLRHWEDKVPGDEIEVEVDDVRRYVDSGAAAPANQAEARKGGVDVEAAATAKPAE